MGEDADPEERFGDEGPVVGVSWLRVSLGTPGVRVVDARPFPRYAEGHIPGAVHLDLYALRLADSSAEAIARFDAEVEAGLRRIEVRPDERVVFYEDFSGTSAARGVWLLDYAGHRGGAMLDGGLGAWIAAGGEVTRAAPAVDASDVHIRPDHGVLATAEEIRAALAGDRPAPLLLDTRNDREHFAGTIPGSIHLEWLHHLNPDGTLRSPAELRALYARVGIGSDEAADGLAAERGVVTYCASGYRAAHAYVVLRALGHRRIKNYVPSWNEWSRRADLPVAVPDE